METGSFIDREHEGRPRLLSQPHYIAIDNAMDVDNELTNQQLMDVLLSKFPDLKVSNRTVARARQELGWVHQTAKYCQLVREVNKQVRLQWAQKMMTENERFDDVVFTDKSTFQVEYHARRAYRRLGEPRLLRPKPKHPAKVHVYMGRDFKKGCYKDSVVAQQYDSYEIYNVPLS